MKKEAKQNILIVVALVLLILFLIGFAIIWGKSNVSIEEKIIQKIEADQKGTDNAVLLYTKLEKLNEYHPDLFGDEEEWKELCKQCDFYYIEIMNDEELWISYIVRVNCDTHEIEWCDEIERR